MAKSDRSPLQGEEIDKTSKDSDNSWSERFKLWKTTTPIKPALTAEDKAILEHFPTFSFDSVKNIRDFRQSLQSDIKKSNQTSTPRSEALKKLNTLIGSLNDALTQLTTPTELALESEPSLIAPVLGNVDDKVNLVKNTMRELLDFVIKNEKLLEKYPRFVAFKNWLIQLGTAILGTTVGFLIGAPAANPLVHAGTATTGAIGGWEAGKYLSRSGFLASNAQKLRTNLEQLDQAINPPLPTTAPKTTP